MGPYQTLRAENRWTQLLERFRVFFDFKKSGFHQKWVQISRDVSFLKKKAAGRLKPRQRGLANRICFYQNPQIPESQIPNLQISKFPKFHKCKSGSCQSWMKKRSTISDCRFFWKFRNWQIQNFQINSPLSTDRFWINRPLPYGVRRNAKYSEWQNRARGTVGLPGLSDSIDRRGKTLRKPMLPISALRINNPIYVHIQMLTVPRHSFIFWSSCYLVAGTCFRKIGTYHKSRAQN